MNSDTIWKLQSNTNGAGDNERYEYKNNTQVGTLMVRGE